jgi:hypothetical protein
MDERGGSSAGIVAGIGAWEVGGGSGLEVRVGSVFDEACPAMVAASGCDPAAKTVEAN